MCAKRTKYAQKFKDEWLELDQFQGWLTKSKKGEEFGFCKPCGMDIGVGNGGKHDLMKHRGTVKHTNKCKRLTGQQGIAQAFASTSREDSLANKNKQAEIRLASYIAEHNISFLAAQHLPHLVKAICPESDVAKNLTLGRTKATCLVKNVIGETEKEDLCRVMRNRKFSIIVDESTDKSTVKNLCIVVRINISDRVIDAFYDLVSVEDASAVGIHTEIVKSLEQHNIPWKSNLIGYAADGANVMMGNNHSVNVLLKKDLPHLFFMKCICHSFALCASYAGEKIPQFVEDLVRDVYN